LNVTYARVLSLPLHDISSGFRLYRRDILRGLECQARDFDILEEILIKVHALGFRIRELPFRYLSRGTGRSHTRFLKFGWAYLKTLVRMWQLRNSVAAADYDHRAFDSPIPLQRYWQRTRHRIVLGFLNPASRQGQHSVLDIGCGSSRIIQDLPRAIGMDILLPKLRFLRDRHSRLVQGSIFALPFPTHAFDAVICSTTDHTHAPACVWAMRRSSVSARRCSSNTPSSDAGNRPRGASGERQSSAPDAQGEY
jgi:SAM-dependent methyltransferase